MTEKQNAAVGFPLLISSVTVSCGGYVLCEDYVTYERGGDRGGPQMQTHLPPSQR